MGIIKSKFPEARTVPGLDGRLVLPDQQVEVPDDEVFNYTQQSGWEPVGPATTEVHEAAAVDQRVAQLVADGGPQGYPAEDADRTEVAAFVVVTAQAEPKDLAGLDAAALREQFVVEERVPVDESGEAEPPALNASTDEWAAYAVVHRGASEGDVAGKKRKELIALYTPITEVEGEVVDGPADRGPAVNADTGEVTAPEEPLPPVESDEPGEPLDPPVEGDESDDESPSETNETKEA